MHLAAGNARLAAAANTYVIDIPRRGTLLKSPLLVPQVCSLCTVPRVPGCKQVQALMNAKMNAKILMKNLPLMQEPRTADQPIFMPNAEQVAPTTGGGTGT